MIWDWIKKKDLQRGITLTEMLVVIALIFIISGTTWLNYRGLDRSLGLDRSSNQVAQDVRRSLEMAMSMQDPGVTIPIGESTGYGIEFRVGDKFYTQKIFSITSGGIILDTSAEELKIELEESIFIKSLLADAAPVTFLRITFIPPHPKTYIGNIIIDPMTSRWYSSNSLATVTLESEDTGEEKVVTVNKVGLIEVGN